MAVHGGLVGQCAVVFVKGHGVDLLIGEHAALECVCVGGRVWDSCVERWDHNELLLEDKQVLHTLRKPSSIS